MSEYPSLHYTTRNQVCSMRQCGGKQPLCVDMSTGQSTSGASCMKPDAKGYDDACKHYCGETYVYKSKGKISRDSRVGASGTFAKFGDAADSSPLLNRSTRTVAAAAPPKKAQTPVERLMDSFIMGASCQKEHQETKNTLSATRLALDTERAKVTALCQTNKDHAACKR